MIALAMLADATADEKEVLGAFGYSSQRRPCCIATTRCYRRDVPPAARWNYRMADVRRPATNACR